MLGTTLLLALLAVPSRSQVVAAPAPVAPVVTVSPVAGVAPGLAVRAMPLQAPLLGSPSVLQPAPLAAAPASLPVIPQLASAAQISAQPAAAIAASSRKTAGVAQTAATNAGLAKARQSAAAAETQFGAGARFFDGAAVKLAESAAPVLPYSGGIAARKTDADWTPGTFRTSDGGTLHFKLRQAETPGKTPQVFVGGLALAESYDALFERQAKPASDQYFLWLRGHSPSEWKYSRTVYEQDARDLARMIVLAGERSGSSKIDLVLHSYGVLVFQRMVQLDNADARRALQLLKDARVTLLMSTTHYGNSETAAGEQYAQMAKVIRSLIGWLDTMDSWADLWQASAKLSPMLAPQIYASLAAWKVQREAVLALASKGGVDELLNHLAEPWDPAIDHIRLDLIARVRQNGADSGWQEAFLKRANDTSRLEFTKADVARIRKLGVHLDLVHSHDDQLVPWVSAKLLFDLLGMRAPKTVPPVGTVLESTDKLFRVTIVDGDHYFPLKKPADMEKHLG